MWTPRADELANDLFGAEAPQAETQAQSDNRHRFFQQIASLFPIKAKGQDPLSFQCSAAVRAADDLLLEVRLSSHFNAGALPEVYFVDTSSRYLSALEIMISSGLIQQSGQLLYQKVFGYRPGMHGATLIYNIRLMFELVRYLSEQSENRILTTESEAAHV